MPKPVESVPEADPLFGDLNQSRGESFGYALWKYGRRLAVGRFSRQGVCLVARLKHRFLPGQIRATASVPSHECS